MADGIVEPYAQVVDFEKYDRNAMKGTLSKLLLVGNAEESPKSFKNTLYTTWKSLYFKFTTDLERFQDNYIFLPALIISVILVLSLVKDASKHFDDKRPNGFLE